MGTDPDLNPFHTVVCAGDLPSVKSYLKSGQHKVDEVNQHGKRAIHYAIENEHFAILYHLIEEGANVDAHPPDTTSEAPLATAIRCSCKDMVRYLLWMGANPKVQVRIKFGGTKEDDETSDVAREERWCKMTPLHVAAFDGDVEMIEWFLESGEIEALDEEGKTPLYRAAVSSCLQAVQRLLEAGADVNARTTTGDGLSSLHLAAVNGNLECVKLLIQYGADVDIDLRGDEGVTPLSLAVNEMHFDVCKFLLENGADPNKRNKNGWTIFLHAVGFRTEDKDPAQARCEILGLLLDHGADINARTPRNGVGALYMAAASKRLELVKFLCQRGAKIDEIGESSPGGVSVMFYAVGECDVEMVKYMLGQIECTKEEINDLIEFAQSEENHEVARFLKERRKEKIKSRNEGNKDNEEFKCIDCCAMV